MCAAGGWWRQRQQHCRRHSFCASSCRCMLCHAVLTGSMSAPMLCLPGVCLLSCTLLLLLQEGHPSTAAAGGSRELDDLHAGDQLPVAQSCKDNQLVLPAAATGFPHEFRYCYWSNEVYRPNKAHQQQQYAALPAGARQPAALAQVSCSCCFFSGTSAPSKC